MKRYGPSRRLAQNASAALRIFVRHLKKTISNNIRHERSFIPNAHHASANLAATEPRPAIDASQASPGLTGTIVPRATDKAISPARNGLPARQFIHQPSHGVQWVA
jgi:hypothetical protein